MPQTWVLPKQVAIMGGVVAPSTVAAFFQTATSTPQSVYTDAALTNAVTSITADAAGVFAKVYLNPNAAANYRVTLTPPGGTPYTEDDISRFPASQADIGAALYPITDAEIAAGVTPTFYIYAPGPKLDVRRYLTAWDDGSVQTTGLQNAINLAYAQKGRLLLPNGLNIKSGEITLTMSGNRTTQGLAIEGAGPNGSTIFQDGTPTQIFNFVGPTPTGNPAEVQLVLENFTVCQAVHAKTAHGITFNGIGGWRISNVQSRGFDRALNLSSALIGLIDQDSYLGDSNTGVYIRRNGTGSTTNLLRIRDSRININSSWAVDFNGGSQLQLHNNDIEANGTTGVTTTGGIVIRGALAPDSFVAGILMDGNWLESNFGRSIFVEAPTGGVTTDLDIRGGNIMAAESGRAITILGGSRVSIRNLQCVTPGDTWDITCTHLALENCVTGTLTDTGVTYPNYRGVGLTTGGYINGRTDSYTGTLTGCTTSPTATVFVNQQGDEITITVGSTLTGTSNTTSCSITGLPARYRPSAQRAITCASHDNGVVSVLIGSVETDGSIRLRSNGSFTGSGVKGAPINSFKFRL